MNHDEEVLAFFQEHFGAVTDPVFPAAGQLHGYPPFLQLFWRRFGFGARADGFVWLLDPAEHAWITALFGLDRRLIPFARTSFGDLHFLAPEGEGYSFSPSYKELQPMAVSLHSAVMSLAEPNYINDDPFYERHQELWTTGKRIDASSCFCLTPALPLGGDEATSYQIAMIRENHPSRASSKEYGLAAMDEHPVGLRMFGNQSKSVSEVYIGDFQASLRLLGQAENRGSAHDR